MELIYLYTFSIFKLGPINFKIGIITRNTSIKFLKGYSHFEINVRTYIERRANTMLTDGNMTEMSVENRWQIKRKKIIPIVSSGAN